MSYNHLNITEHELIAIYRAKSWSICQIAKLLGRNKSTISRELARNRDENPELFTLVKKLFLSCQWSPEQIAAPE